MEDATAPVCAEFIGGDLPVSEFDTVFTLCVPICGSKFMAGGYTVGAMNTAILRARQRSLALLVVAVIDHGHLQADYSGATPRSSGLMRLGRDLMRRAAMSDLNPEHGSLASAELRGMVTSRGALPEARPTARAPRDRPRARG